MDNKTYISTLDKVSIVDIVNIIEDDLNNDNRKNYGFKRNGEVILFGEIINGILANPSLFIYKNKDTVCAELFEAINSKCSLGFNYGYAYSNSGEYAYFGYATDGYVTINFPNISYSNNEWIAKQVYDNLPVNRKSKH